MPATPRSRELRLPARPSPSWPRALASAPRRERWALGALLVGALVLRVWDLDRMSIWQDEGLSLYRASLSLGGILSGEIPLDALVTRDVQPPLYFLLLAGWQALLGPGPDPIWAGRWLSVLASLPAIPLTWALARRALTSPLLAPARGARQQRDRGRATAIDRRDHDPDAGPVVEASRSRTTPGPTEARTIALVAAALATLSPAMLWYGQELRSYSLVLSLGLASVYALLRALDAGSASSPAALAGQPTPAGAGRAEARPLRGPSATASRRAALGWSLAWLLAGAALVWTHYLSVFLLAFEGLAALAFVLRRRDPRILVPLILAGLAGAPLLPYALWRLGIGAERDQHFVPLRAMLRDVSFGLAFGKSAWAWSPAAPGEHLGMLAAELAFAGLLAAGLVGLWRAGRHAAAGLLAGYLLLPVLGLYALTWIKPVYMGVRHILLAAPAAWLLAAAGLWTLERRRRGAGWAAGLLAGLGTLAALQGYYQEPAFAKDEHRAVADYIRQRAVEAGPDRAGDLLALPHPVLQHGYRPLLGDLDIPIVTLPPFLASGLPDARPPGDLLRPLLARHDRIWFVDPAGDYEDWLGRYALPVERRDFPASSIVLDLHAYERDPNLRTADAPMRRPDLRLDGLELLGWEPLPEPLVAGRGGRLRLVWQVEARELPDYKLAFELLDAAGRNQAEGDHEPFHGLRPTHGWDFGTTVYAPHDLQVGAGTPAGRYRLTVRLYDPASGQAFPPEGPAELGELEVVQPDAPPPPARLDIEQRLRARAGPLTVLGFDLPRPENRAWRAGARLPLAAWLAVDPAAATAEAAPRALRAELVDGWGRVAAQAEAALPQAAGDRLWRIDLPLDLPSGAGRYALRLRLLRADGSVQRLWRGDPLPLLPQSATWLTDLRVAAPERVTEAPSTLQHRLSATVGGQVELLGYDGPADALAARVGQELELTLYWRALAELRGRYRVTLQLLPADPATGEPNGPPLAQHDDEPAGGARPTTGWAPGEVVADAHRLRLPETLPAGDYLLIAALYDPARPELPRPEVRQSGFRRDFAVLHRLRLERPATAPPPSTDEASAGDDRARSPEPAAPDEEAAP